MIRIPELVTFDEKQKNVNKKWRSNTSIMVPYERSVHFEQPHVQLCSWKPTSFTRTQVCCSNPGRSWQGVFDTTLYDKDCHSLATGRWFSPGTPISFSNKTNRHYITDINSLHRLLELRYVILFDDSKYKYLDCSQITQLFCSFEVLNMYQICRQ
jgi:hypothetical protein